MGAYIGRAISPSDNVPGTAPVAMLSYDAWQSDFGGDPSIVGTTLYLQSQPVTIVGVAPRHFFGDRVQSNPPAVWIPLAIEPILTGENTILNHPSTNWLYAIGRLKPGTNTMALQSKLSAVLRHWIHRSRRTRAMETIRRYISNMLFCLRPEAACRTCSRSREAVCDC